MSELNKKNVFICKQIFDISNEYKLNIYEGDSLKLNIKNEWGINDFDVIVGNPPYNASSKNASGNTVWQKFVKFLLTILKKNGYTTLIHPSGWRKPNTKRGKFYGMFDLMGKCNQILYLEIHNVADGKSVFQSGTRYDWYILHRTKKYKYTLIKDENGEKCKIHFNKFEWLPNCEFDLINKLMGNIDDKKCKILQSMSTYDVRKKWMSKIKKDDYIYPVIHSTPMNNARIYYSNTKDKGFFGIKKVIFGESGINTPIIDKHGKYAMTQCAMAIQYDTEAEAVKIVKAITSEKFKIILKACSWSSFRIEWNMFSSFKYNFYDEII
jgi:hypothetical protein